MNRVLILSLALLGAASARADDWPQWMGPGRDNVWRETGLLAKFPEGGPKILWRTPVAIGYAGPAVTGGRIFLLDFVTKDNVKVGNFGRKEFAGTERVLCLDEATGKELWKHEYAVKTNISYPSGPRCTPTVHQGKVYTLGAVGHLFCFDADSGKILWEKDLTAEYKTKPALWGYAGHPLVYGEELLCIVGGEGSHVVAFDKDTGKERWKALTSKEQGYSPPTILRAGGKEQLVLLRPDAVTSVDPKGGEVYWSVPYKATSGSIIMSPIRYKDYLFVGGYSNQNLMLRLDSTKPTAEEVWRNKARHGVSPINVQPFLDGDVLYGFDQDGRLYAVEMPTGKRLWDTTEPIGKRPVGSGTAFLVKQGERFWMFNEKGELVIATLSPTGYTEIDRAKVIEPSNVAFGREVVWSPPAYANRHVYIRNDNECICVDLAR